VAAVSVLLLVVKFLAYYFTSSVTVLTDALESIVNVSAGFIGLYSLVVSARPRDRDHPYGHGKAEFISAAIEGTLVAAAGVIILYKAVMQIINPVPVRQLDLGILLLASTALINFCMGFISESIGKKNNSLALQASGKHLKTDTWSTIAILAGLTLLYITGWGWIDSAVAIIFGVYIMFTGYRILRRSIAGIMDEADARLLSSMVDVLQANRRMNWVDLHNLRVIKYGSVLHIDCHLTVPWYMNINEAHAEIDAVGTLIRNRFGEALELFIHTDGCLYSQCSLCSKDDCPVRKHPFMNKVKWTIENISQNKKHEAT
jgi:cation diffusion facilitator family transporter